MWHTVRIMRRELSCVHELYSEILAALRYCALVEKATWSIVSSTLYEKLGLSLSLWVEEKWMKSIFD